MRSAYDFLAFSRRPFSYLVGNRQAFKGRLRVASEWLAELEIKGAVVGRFSELEAAHVLSHHLASALLGKALDVGTEEAIKDTQDYRSLNPSRYALASSSLTISGFGRGRWASH